MIVTNIKEVKNILTDPHEIKQFDKIKLYFTDLSRYFSLILVIDIHKIFKKGFISGIYNSIQVNLTNKHLLEFLLTDNIIYNDIEFNLINLEGV